MLLTTLRIRMRIGTTHRFAQTTLSSHDYASIVKNNEITQSNKKSKIWIKNGLLEKIQQDIGLYFNTGHSKTLRVGRTVHSDDVLHTTRREEFIQKSEYFLSLEELARYGNSRKIEDQSLKARCGPNPQDATSRCLRKQSTEWNERTKKLFHTCKEKYRYSCFRFLIGTKRGVCRNAAYEW
jgi:hypothetical protein